MHIFDEHVCSIHTIHKIMPLIKRYYLLLMLKSSFRCSAMQLYAEHWITFSSVIWMRYVHFNLQILYMHIQKMPLQYCIITIFLKKSPLAFWAYSICKMVKYWKQNSNDAELKSHLNKVWTQKKPVKIPESRSHFSHFLERNSNTKWWKITPKRDVMFVFCVFTFSSPWFDLYIRSRSDGEFTAAKRVHNVWYRFNPVPLPRNSPAIYIGTVVSPIRHIKHIKWELINNLPSTSIQPSIRSAALCKLPPPHASTGVQLNTPAANEPPQHSCGFGSV